MHEHVTLQGVGEVWGLGGLPGHLRGDGERNAAGQQLAMCGHCYLALPCVDSMPAVQHCISVLVQCKLLVSRGVCYAKEHHRAVARKRHNTKAAVPAAVAWIHASNKILPKT